ncbi:ABC transporter substrate-binding protein [Tissierella carlieri]|uniref:ABC transporter substrate-binding protein n=1 Tax=Tissierella carlieri TaxID=689904 RepID=A0ABT1SGM7_9FIRM|nr:ABC transporter substrate-binding protein [Tissierella carlieri]MBU5313005.1 ABC transporter substrate-binding protein [Tissierella carlieri]MCQ4925655.1 ABC transporter substrate-binding protein [Tissierella carlieri]
MRKRIAVFLSIILLVVFIFHIEKNFARYVNKNTNTKYKIGVISATDSRLGKVNAMIDGLYNYGYEKEDLEVIIKNADGDKDKIEPLVQELVKEKVDIIITTGTFETSAAKKYADKESIPIVFIGVGCTVELGFIQDNISPGCNITGVDSHYVQLSGKRLEFLKRIVPDTEDVLILYNPLTTPFGPSSKFLYEAADKLQIELELIPVTNRDEIIETISKNHDKFDGIMLMCSLLFESTIQDIVDASLEYKIPVMGVNDIQVEKGMLAFYGSTNYNEGLQSARLVANVLEGQDPKIIPIESPENLELHINVDTANALGIEIDYSKMTFVDKFVKKTER